ALAEDLVGLDRRGAVRAFHDERRVDAVGVRAGELVLSGGENEDFAGELEELLVRDPLAAVVAGKRAVLRDVGVKGGNVEPGLGVDAARKAGDRGHSRAALVQPRRGHSADVPEALNDAGVPGELEPEPPGGLLR